MLCELLYKVLSTTAHETSHADRNTRLSEAVLCNIKATVTRESCCKKVDCVAGRNSWESEGSPATKLVREIRSKHMKEAKVESHELFKKKSYLAVFPRNHQVRFGEGCFLGVPVLLASADLDFDELWGWDLENPEPSDGNTDDDGTVGGGAPRVKAVSPVKIVARGDVKIGHFDVARFTKTVGPFAKVTQARQHYSGIYVCVYA